MAVELASKHIQPKPWGVADLGPWSKSTNAGSPIGEIWFDRPPGAALPSLLLKLLFTAQPLSIQVHPDDAYARSKGQPNGKTEAWYVLSAGAGAKVALGLHETMSPQQLRQAVDDGSISEQVVWHPVTAGDTILVPAGTIHAIGAGVVIAEIQQKSDATFRLFDHGRQRELHVDDGVAVAKAGPAKLQVHPKKLTDERTLLTSCPHFVFERIMLEPDAKWRLQAERETWLLPTGGGALAASLVIRPGDAIFAEADQLEIHTGEIGMVALVAYAGPNLIPNLLRQSIAPAKAGGARRSDQQPAAAFSGSSGTSANNHIGTTR